MIFLPGIVMQYLPCSGFETEVSRQRKCKSKIRWCLQALKWLFSHFCFYDRNSDDILENKENSNSLSTKKGMIAEFFYQISHKYFSYLTLQMQNYFGTTHMSSQSAPTILIYQVELIFFRVWNF